MQRGQRFEGFTPEGARVLEWSRRILADCDSLQQEASVLRAGLVGRLRIGAIPTTLPMIALLTGPFAERHPQVTITIKTMSSIEIQRGLDDFTLDAGLTYLDNEPLTNVRTTPLYQERYYLFTPSTGAMARQSTCTWAEAATLPLSLLSPDMQNRRILNGLFSASSTSPAALIETNSVLALWGHVRSGSWSTILSHAFLHLFGQPEGIRAIPLTIPEHPPTIGLAIPDRDPATPSARELVRIAKDVAVAKILDAATS